MRYVSTRNKTVSLTASQAIAQGLARDMIGLLTKEQCGKLLAYYDDTYPRRERMPVQKEVYKKLKKGAK